VAQRNRSHEVKIYLSGDIEGATGVTVWDEAEPGKPEYAVFQAQMTAEVAAAYHAFYTGAELENPYMLRFETDDYFEVLRLLLSTT
jgi:hypothetical protein